MNLKILAKTGLGLRLLIAIGVVALAGSYGALALAQSVPTSAVPPDSVQPGEGVGGLGYAMPADVYVPESSIEKPGDAGVSMHTNYVIAKAPGGAASSLTPSVLPPGETPTSMECVYKLKGLYGSGCPKSTLGALTTTGWGAIALVDAYDNPDAANDLKTFSTTFHLPQANFTKVFSKFNINGTQSCSTVPPDANWAVEESLDIEWAHAMAPKAKIYLVESCTPFDVDLYQAEVVAAAMVESSGGGDISNSWSGSEYSTEADYDIYFYYNISPIQAPNITYFASADDMGCGAQYPSSSPWIVSAGGTHVNRLSTGKLNTTTPEACWSGSGGGTSAYESISAQNPAQFAIFGTGARRTPDFSFDADPASGVDIYSQFGLGGWAIVGGTSVSSPALAGIVNSAGNKLGSYFLPPANPAGWFTNQENNLLYSQLATGKAYGTNFYDITTGSNGCPVGTSYDYCTGVGSPRGFLGK